MGLRVIPKNLNDRQVKRVDRIESSDPLRARTVASRISARRDARGAENPQMAKMPGAKPAMAQPMKKGGKMIKKAQNGKVLKALSSAAGSAAEAIKSRKTGMNFDRKGFDSLMKTKNYDSLIKTKSKAKSGGSFPDLNKDGKITKADILKGRGVIAKKGAKTSKKKMQYGGEAASMVPTMKKGGKAMYGKSMMKSGGKCKNGC